MLSWAALQNCLPEMFISFGIAFMYNSIYYNHEIMTMININACRPVEAVAPQVKGWALVSQGASFCHSRQRIYIPPLQKKGVEREDGFRSGLAMETILHKLSCVTKNDSSDEANCSLWYIYIVPKCSFCSFCCFAKVAQHSTLQGYRKDKRLKHCSKFKRLLQKVDGSNGNSVCRAYM